MDIAFVLPALVYCLLKDMEGWDMSDTKQLKELARGIVLAQGNTFLKELLRSNNIKIGATKAAFLTNMNSAIDDGILTNEIFSRWLSEVEGWGKQHAYIYRISEKEKGKQIWMNSKTVQAHTSKLGLGSKWNISPSSVFPENRELSGIYYDDTSFRLIWYEGIVSTIRDKTEDVLNKKIGTDVYDFHAFRHRANRIVTQFDWPIGSNYAAILMQTPWDMKVHDSIRADVLGVVTKYISPKNIELANISNAIKQLDQESVNSSEIKTGFISNSAQLKSGGSYVEFGSTTESGYASASAVRQVRRSVEIGRFRGERADFSVKDNPEFKISRNKSIHIDLRSISNECGWVKIRHMCTRKDVWNILSRIAKATENV